MIPLPACQVLSLGRNSDSIAASVVHHPPLPKRISTTLLRKRTPVPCRLARELSCTRVRLASRAAPLRWHRRAPPTHPPHLAQNCPKLPLANLTITPHTGTMAAASVRSVSPVPSARLAQPGLFVSSVTAITLRERVTAIRKADRPVTQVTLPLAPLIGVTAVPLPRNPAPPSDLQPLTSDLSHLTPRPRCLTLAALAHP